MNTSYKKKGLLEHYFKKKIIQLLKNPILDIGEVGTFDDNGVVPISIIKHKGKIYYCLIVNQYLPKVQLYNTFGQFCQMVNIKNVKPIFNETDKKYV